MKHIIHYPIFFLIAIILNRIIVSSTQISPVQGMRALLVLLVLAGISSVIMYQRTKDWYRTDFLIAAFLAVLMSYQSVYRWAKHQSIEYADILGLVLIPCFGWLYFFITDPKRWKLIRKPSQISAYFNLVFAFLLAFQLVQFGLDIHVLGSSPVNTRITAIPPLGEEIHLDPTTRPDIYVIVLDGYGRQDVLREIYGYDNSEFLNELKERGFYVAGESHSNYVQTPYAVASLMNFDYAQPWRSSSDYAQYLLEPIQNNRVFQLLNGIGYTTVSFEGTASYTQIQDSDVFYSSFLPLNKFETFLLTDTPLEPLTDAFQLGLSIPNYETHRLRALNKFDTLKTIPDSIAGPKITYFHVLVPHPPFVFDEDGNAITPNRPYSIMDASDYPGTVEEYHTGYRKQVIFANKKVLDAVDTILAKSKTPPIIVMMGDHGPGSEFKWDLKDPGCLWERTHNLYAVLLPNHQKDGTAYPSMTPVNTFRVIFNTYFGAKLPLLDDRTYLAAWQYPSTMVDVTNTRDSKTGCTIPDP
jgi:hypothetical protein